MSASPNHREVGSTHRDRRLGLHHPHPIHLRSDQRAERDRLQGQVDAGIQSRRREQIRNQGAGPLRFADEQRLQVLPLIMVELIIVMQQGLRGRLHAGDRGPELVRRVGQERPGPLLGLSGPELRSLELVQHLVEGLGRLAQLGVGTGCQSQPPPTPDDSLGQLHPPGQQCIQVAVGLDDEGRIHRHPEQDQHGGQDDDHRGRDPQSQGHGVQRGFVHPDVPSK